MSDESPIENKTAPEATAEEHVEDTGDNLDAAGTVAEAGETPAESLPAELPEDFADAAAGFPIPPADFSFLVYSLTTQAQLQLGLLRLDEASSPEPNLPIARHTIDLLAMLQKKTQGNLDLQEKLLLENSLTDLRFRFVQLSEQAGRKSDKAT